VTGKLRPHTGTDIGAQYGAQIIAASGGTVIFAGWNGGYGNCAIIDHGGGVTTLYAHMSSISVVNGQSVSAGDPVGKVGSTGNSTGPHLHFEIMMNGVAVDPMQYF
jgi:murein DD-endopeptidase MepM/ murein hydrolase activator NlpD